MSDTLDFVEHLFETVRRENRRQFLAIVAILILTISQLYLLVVIREDQNEILATLHFNPSDTPTLTPTLIPSSTPTIMASPFLTLTATLSGPSPTSTITPTPTLEALLGTCIGEINTDDTPFTDTPVAGGRVIKYLYLYQKVAIINIKNGWYNVYVDYEAFRDKQELGWVDIDFVNTEASCLFRPTPTVTP